MKKSMILLFVLFLTAGVGFGQSMSNPIMIAKTGIGVRWSQMAFGPDGVAHFVWEEHGLRGAGSGHGIYYASYDGTTISNAEMVAQTVQTGEGFMARPYITVSPKGHIVTTWGESQTVYLRIYDAVQKYWLPVETVKTGMGYGEPQAIMDKDGDIFVWWYSDGGSSVYSRFKLNGSWENTQVLAPYGSKQGGMVMGSDGWIWAVWREKQGNGEYKLRYTKRTKTTGWVAPKAVNDAGGSSSHPSITIGPNNIPVIANGDIDESTGENQEMWVIWLDEKTNPRERAVPLYMQHYPRVAVDCNNKVHVANAIGGGDYGDGIRYTNNISGTWKDPWVYGAGWPKTPGIAHDGFGNIAVCWSAMFDPVDGGTRINVASLFPIAKIALNAPTELSASMTFDPTDATTFTYTFNWKVNSQNADRYLKGYKIYKKDGDSLSELVTVDKTSTSAAVTLTEFNENLQFGITTVGLSGLESDMAMFSITYPQVYEPVSLTASIKLGAMKTSSTITYDLSWSANPKNTPDSYVKEYRIYKKEGVDDWTLFQSVSRTTFSASIASTPDKRVLFAISTMSVLKKESSMSVFGQ